LNKNTAAAQESLRLLLKNLHKTKNCLCDKALSEALITNPAVIPSDSRKKLELLVGKYLK